MSDPGNCSFSFIKADGITGARLSNAVFRLEGACTPPQTSTSDQNGLVCFRVAPCCYYILTEQTPPPGYAADATSYQIMIDGGGRALVDGRYTDPVFLFNKSQPPPPPPPTPPPALQVIYRPNGGTGGQNDAGLTPLSVYTIKTPQEAHISNPGSLFVEWNTAPGGSGASYQPGEVITLASNLILYAQWQLIPLLSVGYDANGGVGSSVDAGLIAGSAYTIKTPQEAGISNPGFTFLTWNTVADGSGTTYTPGQGITLTSSLTLYAQWEIEVLATVIYDPGLGDGGHVDTEPLGSLYTIKTAEEADVSFDSFSFDTWNTADDGSGAAYSPGEVIDLTETTFTLYAQWII